MNQKNDGGPAFPFKENFPGPEGNYSKSYMGMTLRDYFAGQALLGFAQRYAIKYKNLDSMALSAYLMADAMIAERNK